MDLIYADKNGIELGYLKDFEIDLEIGDSNDFEITVSSNNAVLDYDYRIYENGTEYGGIIKEIKVDTATNKIKYCGQTWRGILSNYILQPEKGKDYIEIPQYGASSFIADELINFGLLPGLFVPVLIDLMVYNVRIDRYCTLLHAIEKMLKDVGYRIDLKCENGSVYIEPVPIVDYSDELEYSQDYNINFKIDDNRSGINHLVCLGSGELKDRQVVNFYLQADGSISETKKYYTGIDERAEVYDYPNAESLDELKKSGLERFKELLNQKTLEMTIGEINVEIGDIVGGRERITGIEMSEPITRKIIKATNHSLKISYKVG